jgi:hypothetical protein
MGACNKGEEVSGVAPKWMNEKGPKTCELPLFHPCREKLQTLIQAMKGNSSCDSSPNNQSERRDSHQRDDLCATWDSLKN